MAVGEHQSGIPTNPAGVSAKKKCAIATTAPTHPQLLKTLSFGLPEPSTYLPGIKTGVARKTSNLPTI